MYYLNTVLIVFIANIAMGSLKSNKELKYCH